MSSAFTTQNIDQVRATSLDGGRGWLIAFRSANEGMCHQLYVNATLADFTDTTGQRSFHLDAETFPQEVLIAAVAPDSRATDMSEQLSLGTELPPWIYRASVVWDPDRRSGGSMAVLGDHGTGQIDSSPLAVRDLRPEWSGRWGFGQDAFGLGGMGYDGLPAPGMGKGVFGAGQFGIEADVISVAVPLLEECTHKILLRAISAAGEYADSSIQNVAAWPPPASPAPPIATAYDHQSKCLTLQIQ